MPSHRDQIFADQTVRNPSTRLQDLLAQLSSYRVDVVIYIVEDGNDFARIQNWLQSHYITALIKNSEFS